MNTNSKHYEELNIQPWEIMERNFTTEEFVAYLKGNIIKYTLRDKGQALTDAQKIKHYAEKLIEVLETKENDKDNWSIVTGELLSPVYTPKVKPEEPEYKHKFKVGDRVKATEGRYKEKGVIVRLPTEHVNHGDNYLVQLDDKTKGWTACKDNDGIDCKNVWTISESNIELLQ